VNRLIDCLAGTGSVSNGSKITTLSNGPPPVQKVNENTDVMLVEREAPKKRGRPPKSQAYMTATDTPYNTGEPVYTAPDEVEPQLETTGIKAVKTKAISAQRAKKLLISKKRVTKFRRKCITIPRKYPQEKKSFSGCR